MRTLIKTCFHWLLAQVGFRPGAVRRAFWGPYRGLHFALTPPMQGRLRVFYAAYEREVQVWLAQHIKPGMTVYVVGAHAGIHVLFIARLLQGKGHLYAFEGWSENHAALRANIAANPSLAPLIEPVAACISSQSGTVTMAQGASDGKHRVATRADKDRMQVSVPAVSLDDFVADGGAVPGFILMDIEGHELDALKGSLQLIQTRKPALMLEFHNDREALVAHLTAHAYHIEILGGRHIIAR